MLHRDILVLHGLCRLLGTLEGLVHVLGHIDFVRLPAAAGHLGQLFHFRLDGRLEAGHRHSHGSEQLGNKALLVGHQRQQQVLLLNLLLPVLLGQVPGPLDGREGFLSKLIHIHMKETSFFGFPFFVLSFSTRII